VIAAEHIQEIYPLSPLQSGILFETVYAPGVPLYVVQSRFELEGKVDASSLKRAWQMAATRHSILRTAFVWKRVEKPCQVVLHHVDVPLAEHDWRTVGDHQRAQRRREFLQADRQQAFDLSKAPLFRLALIRWSDTSYELVFSYHHLILDGWSQHLLFDEVMAAYVAKGRDTDRPLPSPRPYADYIAWLDERESTAAEKFWRGYLDAAALNLHLFKDLADTTGGDGPVDNIEHQVVLDAAASERIRVFARRYKLTLNTLVQAAWALLLSRYSGCRDVIFGATVSGRSPQFEDCERMIGLFINTVPVRIQVEDARGLVEWLQAIQRSQAEASDFEYMPLTQIRDAAGLNGGHPLFDSIVVVGNYPRRAADGSSELSLDGVTQQGIQVRAAGTEEGPDRAVVINVLPGSQIRLRLSYSRALLWSASDLTRHLANILGALPGVGDHPDAAMAPKPTRRVGDVEILTRAEQEDVLRTSRGPSAERRAETVAQQMSRQAQQAPDAIAVVHENESVTYGELERRTNQLGHHLQGQGVGAEVCVGVCLERGVELAIALLGVLKAGGSYVPLDPEYPPERLRYMVADCTPAMLITRPELANWAHGVASKQVHLERDAESIQSRPTLAVPSALQPRNLIYTIYTSGSSGQPKGAMNTHGGVSNRLTWMREFYGLQPRDRMLQKTSVSFDVSVSELFGPLVSGACVVVARRGGERDASYLLNVILQEQITIVDLVPSMLEVWVKEPGVAACTSVRLILTGGETLTPTLSRDTRTTLRAQLHNMYGPTEAAVDVTQWECGSGPEDHGVPIGRPSANTQVYVLLEGLALAPPGVTAELYIGGTALGRGYVNRPALTAERFVPHPYGPAGTRLYRTGDRARWRSDGQLEFLGRVDAQVKVRGYRIELGEVESALRSHDGVAEAVVVIREDDGAGKRLVAYVVPAAGGRVEGRALQRYVSEKLPAYMVPTAVGVVERLPLTRSGKVDRQALAAARLPAAQRDEDGAGEAPRTPLEELVAAVWEEVLGRSGVGREDNFFELGGHSLLATQVVARVRQALEIEVPLRVVFETPTVAAMAAAVEAAKGEGQRRVAPPLKRMPRHGEDLPLSYAQQRLWFLDQLEPGSAVYNVPHTVRLEGRLDVAALEWSLRELARRHEVLRTTFPSVNGTGVQRIAAASDVRMEVVDVNGEDAAQAVVRAEAVQGFDLARGPVWRATLVRLAPEDHVLVVVLHHIVSDGWSVSVMGRELTALYTRYGLAGAGVELEELPVQYGDYTLWQREWLAGEVLPAQVAYWKQQLADLAPLDLPTDYRRPAAPIRAGGRVKVALGAELTHAVEALSRREGVTLFMTLLAAFQVVLARWAGQQDAAVGTPIAGRRHVETEALIGFFVNTLVLRTRWTGNPAFQTVLKQVRGTVLAAYEHQDVPFEKLVEELEPTRALNRTPLFQIAFGLQNAPGAPLRLGSVKARPIGTDTMTARFDLALDVSTGRQGVTGVVEYATELYAAETVTRLAGHWRAVLERVAEDLTGLVGNIPLLSVAERAEVVEAWNGTEQLLRSERLDEELMEQVGRAPDHVAMVYGDEHVSYRELEWRSGALAEQLRGLGVCPDDRVLVCLERSGAFVEALVAIVRAGAAYVPMNPEDPAPRLQWLAACTQARVVVTRRQVAERLPPLADQILCVDEPRPSETRGAHRHDTGSVDGASLAYVLFTSGSTGQPKGVEVGHRAVMRLVKEDRAYVLGREDVSLMVSAVTFDASTFEIWGALLNGGRLEIYAPGVPLVEELGRFLDQRGITVLLLTSGLFHQMVDGALDGLRGLRQLLVGGDVLSVPHTRTALRALTGGGVVNAYGPTENATITACHRMAGALGEVDSVPIGKPIANTTVYVLDAYQEPVPIGVTGELYTGGKGLARGYSQRGDLTAEKFVPNSFGGVGDRLYRTGDWARWTRAGELEFMGRVDNQVKVRGYRIEPGEVEAVLRDYAGVQDAVVVARQVAGRRKQLVAYLVGREGRAVESGPVREYLRGRLPEYMVPSWVVPIAALPLTSHGKVDLVRLPPPDAVQSAESAYVGPRNETEAALVHIWERVLRVRTIGVHDNFFAIGGDSILSIQIVAQARQAGLQVSVRDIFTFQTIASLAAEGCQGEMVHAEQGEVTGPVPLTPIQAWYLELPSQKPDHFNQSLMLDAGDWNGKVVERATEALTKHHDALRMAFALQDGRWTQTNEPWARQRAGFVWIDLSLTEPSDWRACLECAAAMLQRSLSLSRGQLARAAFLDEGSGRPRLMVVLHHLVVDGVSWRILVEDLHLACHQAASGLAIELPAKTSSYQQWAAALARYAESEQVQSEIDYWERVEASGRSTLPRDASNGDNTVASGRVLSVALDKEETARLLRDVNRRQPAGVQEVLLTALVEALGGWTGTSLWRADVERHGREAVIEAVDVSRTVGWFTTIHPVALGGVRGLDLQTRLEEVTAQMAAVPGQGIGYGVLRHLRGHGLGRTGRPDIGFNYLGQFDPVLDTTKAIVAAKSTGPNRDPADAREYLLQVTAMVRGDRLQVQFDYSANVHHTETIGRLSADFLGALRELIALTTSPRHALQDGFEELSSSDLQGVLSELG
jgi:amino acid adenylation domain-containing protein/non-ribosomal peptide synthase protein (TIGR01720 family)